MVGKKINSKGLKAAMIGEPGQVQGAPVASLQWKDITSKVAGVSGSWLIRYGFTLNNNTAGAFASPLLVELDMNGVPFPFSQAVTRKAYGAAQTLGAGTAWNALPFQFEMTYSGGVAPPSGETYTPDPLNVATSPGGVFSNYRDGSVNLYFVPGQGYTDLPPYVFDQKWFGNTGQGILRFRCAVGLAVGQIFRAYVDIQFDKV